MKNAKIIKSNKSKYSLLPKELLDQVLPLSVHVCVFETENVEQRVTEGHSLALLTDVSGVSLGNVGVFN